MNETNEKIVAVPCPYMVFKSHGYHECAIMTAQHYRKFPETRRDGVGVVCAWFYDLGGIGWSIEMSYNKKTGKRGFVSDFDFPDIIREKARSLRVTKRRTSYEKVFGD